MSPSIIIPCYNEEENIGPLLDEVRAMLDSNEIDGEIIVVDDGSTDDSFSKAAAVADQDPRVRIIRLRRNFGQTAAMVAGIDHAQNEVLVPMDADLQNDPADVPALLKRLDEGFDVVSGWRKQRQDRALTRRLPSYVANNIISRISGVRLHDYGCTLKAYRREVLEDVRLYGEMHRFIPIYASWAGAKVTEMVVNHRARVSGRSKYGLSRTFKVILDLITVTFLSSYVTKPIYFFGTLGMFLCGSGVLAGFETLYEKFVYSVKVHTNPVILLAIFLFLAGLQLILIGLLAEIVIRTYHEAGNIPTYLIREVRNLPDREAAS